MADADDAAARAAEALVRVQRDHNGRWDAWLALNGGEVMITSRRGPGTREIAEDVAAAWARGLAAILAQHADGERARCVAVAEAVAAERARAFGAAPDRHDRETAVRRVAYLDGVQACVHALRLLGAVD